MRPESGNSSSSDEIYLQIRRRLIEGQYPPGSRLIEERLAQDLGVSRTPIRQALARAAAEGLVQLYPNRGAVARSFTQADLLEIYELRSVLEGHAAARAATRISAAQLAELAQIATALEQAQDEQFPTHADAIHFLVEQNARFHALIITTGGNQRLAAMLSNVVNVPLQFRSFYWYSPAERERSNFFHRSILNALSQGDADRARAIMQEHIYHGRDVLIANLRDELA
jgi:DNA-binding GntR family transcriptional regulator